MTENIDAALVGWDFKAGMVQARMVEGEDGRQLVQMRVDLGVLQMETNGRPDGHRPHGLPTYFDYLKQQAKVAKRAGKTFVLDEEQCEEADREFFQYYHRRLSWLALCLYEQAVADADHTLAFMDFVHEHAPNDDYKRAHEQFRGFVLFHRIQAASALANEQNNPEKAIDEIRAGLGKLRNFFVSFDAEDQMEDDDLVKQLRKMEEALRKQHKIGLTLQEQLEKAVANEEYEAAAKLRDALKRRR